MNTNINVDLNKMDTEVCPCGCHYFKQRTIIKRIPALLAASKSDTFVNAEYMACEKCGRPHRATPINTLLPEPPAPVENTTP